MGLLVGITLDLRLWLPLFLDTVQSRANSRCQGNIRIGIGGPETKFNALGLGTAGNHSQRRGAIIDAPGSISGCPKARH